MSRIRYRQLQPFFLWPLKFLYLNIHYNVYDVKQITFIRHLLQNFYEALFVIIAMVRERFANMTV